MPNIFSYMLFKQFKRLWSFIWQKVTTLLKKIPSKHWTTELLLAIVRIIISTAVFFAIFIGGIYIFLTILSFIFSVFKL